MTTVDLLIRLRRQSDDTYTIEMQRRDPDRPVPVEPLAQLAARPTFTLDRTRALALAGDPQAYGLWLGELLFGEKQRYAALREALTAAGPEGLLRLRLDLENDLHALAWESVSLPDLGPLATGQRILLSRYLESDRGYVPQPAASPRAVVAVADPPDIGTYGLARPDAARYRDAVAGHLDGFAVDVVPATPPALRNALRQPADLFYLVAHGALRDGRPFLFLENNQGITLRVAGAELVQDVSALAVQPRLVILISCHSGGDGKIAAPGQDADRQDPLAALGPQLVRAGVPAVVAMRSEVTMNTAESFLPVLFNELARDGLIDRALAAARRDVAQRPDAWAPVLFMRLPDGRLFDRAEPATIPIHAEPPPTYFVPPPAMAIARRQLLESGSGRAAVTALVGMAGSGKSTVARALAHDPALIRERFPDGVLWVTLGREADESDILAALIDRLQVLGEHEFRPTTVEAASQHLGDLLEDRKLLVVVDDAWEARDVRPFLSGGAGCHVLITTRRLQVAQECNAVPVTVDAMDGDRAMALLAGLLERPLAEEEAEIAAAVADAVGYLPLALEQVAARIRRDISWERLLEGLRREVARLEELETDRRRRRRGEIRIEASLNVSLEFLRAEDEEAWEAFLFLGLLPEDAVIAAPAAATLWEGIDRADADEILAILQEEMLLSGAGEVKAGDRSWSGYAMHDVLRAVARRRLAAEPPHGLGLELPKAHAALLERYRERTRAGLWHTLPDDGYIQRYLTAHLRGAQRAGEVHKLLAEVNEDQGNGWYEVRERLGQPAGYAADVNTAWQLAETDPPAYALQVRYALIITSLNSLAANVPPALLTRLLEAGLWSPGYTLAYARQIADPRARSRALAAIGANLPERDRSRAAADARDTILALPDDALVEGVSALLPLLEPAALLILLDHLAELNEARARVDALLALLPALSAEHEEQALAVARASNAAWDRARALAALGHAWQRPAPLDEALEEAATIDFGPDRAGAFADVLVYLPESRRAEALERLGDYDRLDDRFWIWAEAQLLPYRPPAEREQRVRELLEIAEPLAFDHLQYGWPAPKALKPLLEITPFLPETEQARLWRMAFERIDNAGEKRALLAEHAAKLPRGLVVEESAALLEWATGADAPLFVDGVVPYLPLSEVDPTALLAQIDAIVDPERLYPLALLLAHLPRSVAAGPARAILTRIREAYDVEFRVRMITALVPALTEDYLPTAVAAIRQVGDAPNRHAAENSLAAWLAANGPPPEAEPNASVLKTAPALAAATEAETIEEGARRLAESATYYQYQPEQKVLVAALLNETIAAGHGEMVIQTPSYIDDEETRALWITALASHLPADSLIDLYAATWDDAWAGGSLWYAAQVRAGITPAVVDALAADETLGARLLPHLKQAAAAGDLTGLPDDPAAHLRDVLVNAAVRAAHDITDWEVKAQTLARLAPYLPPDQRHGLYRRALDLVWERQNFMSMAKTGSKWDTVDASRPIAADFADPLLGIGGLLPVELIAEALNRVNSLATERSRAQILIALAPYLDETDFESALEKAGRLATPRHRAGALIGLAPHLPADALEAAIDLARALDPAELQLRALLPLLRRAATVAPAQLPGLWPTALHLASRGRRPEFLGHLQEMLPALNVLGGPEALKATREAVVDVGRWWP